MSISRIHERSYAPQRKSRSPLAHNALRLGIHAALSDHLPTPSSELQGNGGSPQVQISPLPNPIEEIGLTASGLPALGSSEKPLPW